MKKCLSIQLHLSPTDDRVQNLLLTILNASLPNNKGLYNRGCYRPILVSFDHGKEEGVPYTNMNFDIEDVKLLWDFVKPQLDIAKLLPFSIVVCEGPNGWDDYHLLHSFDPAEKIDEIGASHNG
jgi:hypothetical protein